MNLSRNYGNSRPEKCPSCDYCVLRTHLAHETTPRVFWFRLFSSRVDFISPDLSRNVRPCANSESRKVRGSERKRKPRNFGIVVSAKRKRVAQVQLVLTGNRAGRLNGRERQKIAPREYHRVDIHCEGAHKHTHTHTGVATATRRVAEKPDDDSACRDAQSNFP